MHLFILYLMDTKNCVLSAEGTEQPLGSKDLKSLNKEIKHMCVLGQIRYESILYLKTASGCSEGSRAYPGPLTDQCREHRVSFCFPARKGQGRDSKGSLPPTDSPLQEKGLLTRKLHLDSEEKRVEGYITTSGSLLPAPELSLSHPWETCFRTQREACSSPPNPHSLQAWAPQGHSPPGMSGGSVSPMPALLRINFQLS